MKTRKKITIGVIVAFLAVVMVGYEWFSHLAIEVPGEKTSSEWCETVTDEIYGK